MVPPAKSARRLVAGRRRPGELRQRGALPATRCRLRCERGFTDCALRVEMFDRSAQSRGQGALVVSDIAATVVSVIPATVVSVIPATVVSDIVATVVSDMAATVVSVILLVAGVLG